MRRAKVQIWRARDGWRWRLKAANGRIIAESGEAYTRRRDARRAWFAVCSGIPRAERLYGMHPVEALRAEYELRRLWGEASPHMQDQFLRWVHR